MTELKIDNELRNLLPPLTDEEYKQLEKNIVENGFDKNFPIMEWHGFIVDGHNRYSICKKHNIKPVIGTLAYDTKEEVMEWMLDIQLGRRNLSPIQRIAVAEKYRSIYEKQAIINKQNAMSEARKKNENNRNEQFSQNSSTTVSSKNKIDVRAKLAETAGVSTDTYSKGKKILDSDNEEVKQAVLSGDMSINAGYNKIKERQNVNIEENITTTSTTAPQTSKFQPDKPKISEEVKKICADLKTEKTKEYLDSIWDYKVAIIECMNADFNTFFNGFVSTLNDMDGHVTIDQKEECIKNAENLVEQMLFAIEEAKKIKTKMED